MSESAALPALPIRESLPELLEAVAHTGTAVLAAPPGTGKTTLAPLALAGLAGPGGPPRRVLVAEPRRIAARAAAQRMAAVLGERVGERVGYRIRGETRRSARTRVEVVTTGVLLNRLLGDPELPGVDVVVLDECHERHLETDTACAFLIEAREFLRPELALVAASATADVALWTDLLSVGDRPAPVVGSEPMRHPVAMHWVPPRERVALPDGLRVDPRFLAHVAHVVDRALAEDEGDALVFLPGAGEIRRVAEQLQHLDADIYQLHGSVSSAEQDRALSATPERRESTERSRPRRKVVLATDIAESSLTVPGVRIVVDAGLARRPVVDHARGLPGLTTGLASRASVDQRAGRAGREAAGSVWRCWSEAEHARRAAQPVPDVESSDLAAFRLQAACWGTPVAELRMPGRPPAGAIEAAEATLTSLGALDPDGNVTARGRTLVKVGLHPRLARALLDGSERVGTAKAAEVAALLSLDRRGRGDDLLAQWRRLRTSRDRQWQREADRLARAISSGDRSADSGMPAVDRSTSGEAPGGVRSTGGPAAGVDRSASRHELEQVERSTSRALSAVERSTGRQMSDADRSAGRGVSGVERSTSDDEAAATVVALAFPERVARRTGGQWLTAGGTGAVCAEGSSLGGSEWLAIADADRSPGRAAAVIRAGVPIDAGLAAEIVGERVRERVEWDRRRRDVVARSVRMVAAIEVGSRPLRDADPALVQGALLEGLREEGLELLRWSTAARELRERMAFCHKEIGEPWPDVADAALLGEVLWLEPWWSRARRRGDLERIPVLEALRSLLPWSEDVDRVAPVRLTLSNGRSARVDYSTGLPVLAMKLQEFFGATAIPRVGGVQVQARLLSPAGRPLAVTADLASFWAGPYRQVRKEMRGRYPKHPWPQDPVSAEPTSWTNRRLREQG